jgi:flagellar hook-length control protein FliK
LFSVIKPLERAPDGSYQLHLELKPPELGRVDLRVEMRDGVLHASIQTEHPRTAELVRSALDDLRARLSNSGVRSGELSVSDHGAGSSERENQHTPDASKETVVDVTETNTPPVATDVASETSLDVRM